MEIDLESQEQDTQHMNIEHYHEYGITVFKNLIDIKFCHAIIREDEEKFQLQADAKGYSSREELFEKIMKSS